MVRSIADSSPSATLVQCIFIPALDRNLKSNLRCLKPGHVTMFVYSHFRKLGLCLKDYTYRLYRFGLYTSIGLLVHIPELRSQLVKELMESTSTTKV